jgi:hypothetical protein
MPMTRISGFIARNSLVAKESSLKKDSTPFAFKQNKPLIEPSENQLLQKIIVQNKIQKNLEQIPKN